MRLTSALTPYRQAVDKVCSYDHEVKAAAFDEIARVAHRADSNGSAFTLYDDMGRVMAWGFASQRYGRVYYAVSDIEARQHAKEALDAIA